MLDTRPNDFVYARLSHLAYLDDGGASSSLMPSGWSVLELCAEEDGYVGFAYKHVKKGWSRP